jgi:hypothetical protein
MQRVLDTLKEWQGDEELRDLIAHAAQGPPPLATNAAKVTTGIAVHPDTFEKIRAACGSVPLADAPADQDVLEFELEFSESGFPGIHLDILTTKAPGGNGAIARFLEKFGEGIQQVEIDVSDVDRATEILRTRFKFVPIYPATRAGANGTRVNFFLVVTPENQKLLVELVEARK